MQKSAVKAFHVVELDMITSGALLQLKTAIKGVAGSEGPPRMLAAQVSVSLCLKVHACILKCYI